VKQRDKPLANIDMNSSSHHNNILHNQICVLVFMFALTLVANGQEQKVSKDTSASEMQFFDPQLPFVKPELTLPPSLQLTSSNYSLEYMRSSLTAPISLTEKTNNEIQGIWQRELAQQNEYRTLKTILSSVQMGATAYLLYEHIHKYGLK
jgi:hypothetical protein